MKTLVQLLIVALVLHGCFRVGQVTWRYYMFKDAVAQEARLGSAVSDDELTRRVLDLADEHDLPLAQEDVTVQRRGDRTTVSGTFIAPIVLVPAFYTRDQLFEFEVSVRTLQPIERIQ